jgi:hypothetical protein
MIFVFIGELTNLPNKMFPETGPYSLKYQVKMFKKSIFFFVEDMDLFVALNLATFKNVLCIPIVWKYVFHFCCIHGNKKEKSKPVAIRYLR